LRLPLEGSNLDYRIQSSRVGACLEDTMSASGDLPSIDALGVRPKMSPMVRKNACEMLVRVLPHLS
jgi:hypothetical protein